MALWVIASGILSSTLLFASVVILLVFFFFSKQTNAKNFPFVDGKKKREGKFNQRRNRLISTTQKKNQNEKDIAVLSTRKNSTDVAFTLHNKRKM